MSSQKLQPLSGFPEFLPQEQIVFDRVLVMIRAHFERAGFAPLETSSVERTSTLTAKGGDEKEIYALARLHGDTLKEKETEMALHFDLTVPLARYVSMYQNELAFPFRRYQIQKVWRGERPQAGRYREFYQCDIDIIGREKLALLNDAEMPFVMYGIFRVLQSDLACGDFTIWINNRKFIQGYLLSVGVKEKDLGVVLHIIDKRDKVGASQMVTSLAEYVLPGVAQTMGEFFVAQPDMREQLSFYINNHLNDLLTEGAQELHDVLEALDTMGVPQTHVVADLGIVRGLDYYTGTVYETTLHDHPELGSVCSGGRYDDLTGEFNAVVLPGVGMSIGLSRMMGFLFGKGVIPLGAASPTQVLVTSQDDLYVDKYLSFVRDIRDHGISCEYYSEGGKFEKQMKYAHAKGIGLVVIMGEDEEGVGTVMIKNLDSGKQVSIKQDALISTLRDMIR